MLIAQISDPHLRPEGELYAGLVDSNAMMAAAVRHLNQMTPKPDLVLLSGDIVDEGRPEEYTNARKLLRELAYPLLVIPGNHDEREAFRRAFGDHAYLPPKGPHHFVVGDRGPVRIIGWDVTIPGEHHATIDDEAAGWLEAALAQEPGRATIIMMHHHPFKSGIPYLDLYRCHNGERLQEIVQRFPAVERILCGHVHRFMQMRFGNTALCTAPSVSVAIAIDFNEDAEARSYIEPPSLLLHRWSRETGIVTHLIPIGNFPGPLPIG